MDMCFTGSASRIGGVSFKHLAEEVLLDLKKNTL